MTIEQALASLDATDDAQWTAAGLPRLEVVRELTGDASLSREDIEAAAPGFSRDNPVVVKSTAPEAAPEMSLDELIAKCRALVAELDAEKRAADRALAEALRQQDALIEQKERLEARATQNQEAIQAYHDASKRDLAERGARMQRMRESGVDIKVIAQEFGGR